jgi:uncharacterized protein
MLLDTITIEPGQGASGIVQAGQFLRAIDVAGQQVLDFSSFNADDPSEYCDLIYSLFAREAWKLGVGDVLYTKRMRPLWQITADTCGVHEWTGGFCSHDLNRFLGVDCPGCRDVLEAELVKLDLSPLVLSPSSCLNPFMNMIRYPNGDWLTRLPNSRPGDYLELRAEMKVLWIATTCTMQPPVNGLPLSPIRIEIYA